MKIYSNSIDAISDLHTQGFTHDFKFSGNKLFCVQENIFIDAEEFAIMECCQINSTKKMGKMIVFAIIGLHYHIKGILLARLKERSNIILDALAKENNDLLVLN